MQAGDLTPLATGPTTGERKPFKRKGMETTDGLRARGAGSPTMRQPALVSFRLDGLYSKGGGAMKGVPACASAPLRHASRALPLGPCFVFMAEGPSAIAAEL